MLWIYPSWVWVSVRRPVDVCGALAEGGRRFVPLRRPRINVCIYNPAICNSTRLNRTQPTVAFSLLFHCLARVKCGMHCMHGVASINRLRRSTSSNRSGVTGGTHLRRLRPVRIIRCCLGHCRRTVRTLGILPPDVRPRTSNRVVRRVRLMGGVLSGKCTCRDRNSICFSIRGCGGSRGCNILSKHGVSSVLGAAHTLSKRSRGHGPVSFTL